jgi:hypothetical protein
VGYYMCCGRYCSQCFSVNLTVPKEIQEIANEHMKSLIEAREKAMGNNLMFKTHTVEVDVDV